MGDEEVRAAYAELAKRTHPDRFASASAAVRRVAEEVFGMVSAAYEAIAVQASRLQYLRDEAGRRQLEQEIDEGQRAVRAELEFQKGEVALRARRPDLAVTHFQTAVDSYPDEGEYHAWLGWALHLTAPGNPITLKKAFAHVHKGRKLAPDRAKPYLFLGRLYLAEGRSEVAEKMFSKTVQLDPDCLDALRELRLLNLRREKAKGLVRAVPAAALTVHGEKIWLDGRMLPWDEAHVHVLTHTLHYGLGVFEGIRCYRTDDGRSAVFRLPEHVGGCSTRRTSTCCEIPFSREEVTQAILETLRANRLAEGYIRPLVFIGDGAMGLNPADNPIRVAVIGWPWGTYLGEEGMERGIRARSRASLATT